MVESVQVALRSDMHRLLLEAPPQGLHQSLHWHQVAAISQWVAASGAVLFAGLMLVPGAAWLESLWPWALGGTSAGVALSSATLSAVGRSRERTHASRALMHIASEYGVTLRPGVEFRLIETRALDPRLTATASALHSMPIQLRRTSTGA